MAKVISASLKNTGDNATTSVINLQTLGTSFKTRPTLVAFVMSTVRAVVGDAAVVAKAVLILDAILQRMVMKKNAQLGEEK